MYVEYKYTVYVTAVLSLVSREFNDDKKINKNRGLSLFSDQLLSLGSRGPITK